MERVYLDTCVWCRPFDKPTPRITKEAEALHTLLSLADEARVEIICSTIVLFETSMIDITEKRDAVYALILKSVDTFAEVAGETERLAAELSNKCKLDSMDAAHIAVAHGNGADTFLTTDDELLGKKDCISKFGVIVKNPVDYTKAVQK